MATEFFIKKGDRLPTIAATLKDGAGSPIVLTGATVRFRMRAPGALAPKVSAAGTVVDAAAGKVAYAWAANDTDTAGTYYAEWEVTDSTGKVQVVPNGPNYLVVTITATLS